MLHSAGLLVAAETELAAKTGTLTRRKSGNDAEGMNVATARKKRIAVKPPELAFDDPHHPSANRLMRICDQVELEAAANAISRAMLRGFVGLAIGNESLPTMFVSSTELAAEIVSRWNARETQP